MTSPATSTGTRPEADAPFAAVWCTELELSDVPSEVLLAPASAAYATARVLVRVHGEPIGYLQTALNGGALRRESLLADVRATLSTQLEAHLAAEGLPVPPPGQAVPAAGADCPSRVEPVLDVTVVVCTRGRAELLPRCLSRLAAVTYPRVEFVVVDNAPSDDSTQRAFAATVGEDRRFRYVVEPRPGLSCARNRGLAEASGQVVAYTDDDVSVDPRWVDGIVRGFSRSSTVGCVTGPVCTASIESPAEAYFDARVSWSGLEVASLHELARAAEHGPLYPYQPGLFGTGANFAFRVEALHRLGGFDEALGAGTLTAGGEDLDAFVRVLQAGYGLGYEPSALVWHHHRADMADLSQQMFAYGTGLSAFVTKHLLGARTRVQVLRRVGPGLAHLARVRSTTESALAPGIALPRALLLRELAGMAAGPLLYLRARRAVPAGAQPAAAPPPDQSSTTSKGAGR